MIRRGWIKKSSDDDTADGVVRFFAGAVVAICGIFAHFPSLRTGIPMEKRQYVGARYVTDCLAQIAYALCDLTFEHPLLLTRQETKF